MFECKICSEKERLIAEQKAMIDSLKDTNRKLTDSLVAINNPEAFGSVHAASMPFNRKDYYGGEGDERIEYDQFGQRVLVNESAKKD